MQVVDAVGAAGLAADAEAAEEVDVDEEVDDLVDRRRRGWRRPGRCGRRAGGVLAVRGLAPEPVADGQDVVADLGLVMVKASATSSGVAPWGWRAR